MVFVKKVGGGLNEGLAQPNDMDIAHDLRGMDRGIPHRQIGLTKLHGVRGEVAHDGQRLHQQRR
jgi:hypothetical protein